jgi:hypothetical protein
MNEQQSLEEREYIETKEFFELAKQKGWKQGVLIFRYLSDTQIMQYTNIREKFAIENAFKGYVKIEDAIKSLKEHGFDTDEDFDKGFRCATKTAILKLKALAQKEKT